MSALKGKRILVIGTGGFPGNYIADWFSEVPNTHVVVVDCLRGEFVGVDEFDAKKTHVCSW